MTLTREERLRLADQNAELTQILKDSPPAKGLDSAPDIIALRAYLSALKRKLTEASTPLHASYTEQDLQIPMRDNINITLRIHRPKTAPAGGSPGLVVYHGGGFCLGNCDNEVTLCRKWTELGGVAVNVEYRLAPENVFPKAVEDAYDSLVWASKNIKELGINPKRGFFIGGVSAGANLAAVISHQYRDEKLEPPVTGQYLSIPTTCEPVAVPEKYKEFYLSRGQNKEGLILNQKSTEIFEGHYKPDGTSPLRSPLLFPSHEGLSPAYIQVCGADPLRDEGLLYEQELREAGVTTKLDIFRGLPHGFWSWWPEAEFSRDFQEKTVEGLKWLLEQQ